MACSPGDQDVALRGLRRGREAHRPQAFEERAGVRLGGQHGRREAAQPQALGALVGQDLVEQRLVVAPYVRGGGADAQVAVAARHVVDQIREGLRDRRTGVGRQERVQVRCGLPRVQRAPHGTRREAVDGGAALRLDVGEHGAGLGERPLQRTRRHGGEVGLEQDVVQRLGQERGEQPGGRGGPDPRRRGVVGRHPSAVRRRRGVIGRHPSAVPRRCGVVGRQPLACAAPSRRRRPAVLGRAAPAPFRRTAAPCRAATAPRGPSRPAAPLRSASTPRYGNAGPARPGTGAPSAAGPAASPRRAPRPRGARRAARGPGGVPPGRPSGPDAGPSTDSVRSLPSRPPIRPAVRVADSQAVARAAQRSGAGSSCHSS